MSNIIPKERLSAYQRWELASLGEEPQPKEDPGQAKQEAEMLARQLVQMQEEARRQGYAAGLEQGHAEGFEAGHAEGFEASRAKVEHEAAVLREVANAFSVETAQASETIADEMLDLALDLAKAMLKTALKIRPELVLPVVGEAIRYLPNLQQPALLVLHPEDAPIVRHHLGDELDKSGWRIAEDPNMERSGCRVETPSNQIDASASVRWQRLTEALGKQSGWLE
jgi:flagellar assembly protein FliH